MADLEAPPHIPHPGVDARSWLGFEQRVRHRRFDALVASAWAAIGEGNTASAAHAVDEAREIRPGADELLALDAAIARLRPDVDSRTQWRRARGAVLLLAAGVIIILGLDLTRLAPGTLRTLAPPPPDLIQALPLHRDETPRAVTFATTAINLPPAPAPIAVREEMTIKPGSPITESSDAPGRGSDVLEALDVVVRPAAESGGPGSSTGGGVQGAPGNPTVDAGHLSTPDDLSSSPGNAPASASTRATDPPAVESSAVPDDSVSEQSLIADVLHRYARAYGDLNVSAAREVWPDVDHRALARAFDSLASQTVSFDECRIDISGAVAQASCRGEASYVVKVGHNEPRTEARTWRFQLRRDGSSWKIASAEARGDAH